jgi:hypothetical protein
MWSKKKMLARSKGLYKRRAPRRRNCSISKLIGFSLIGKNRSIDEPRASATSLPAALARRRRLKRRLVTPITERRARRLYGYQHRTEEEPMLTTTSRQTLVNLAAAAWVGALMMTGYYIFSVLVTVS